MGQKRENPEKNHLTHPQAEHGLSQQYDLCHDMTIQNGIIHMYVGKQPQIKILAANKKISVAMSSYIVLLAKKKQICFLFTFWGNLEQEGKLGS